MRLSEAILLGSSQFHATGGRLFDGEGGACALGMGLAASGCEIGIKSGGDVSPVIDEWPWTSQSCKVLPCECNDGMYLGYVQAIAHVFDYHIATAQPTWTLEQLVDWIRSVEPAEPMSTQIEGRDPVDISSEIQDVEEKILL